MQKNPNIHEKRWLLLSSKQQTLYSCFVLTLLTSSQREVISMSMGIQLSSRLKDICNYSIEEHLIGGFHVRGNLLCIKILTEDVVLAQDALAQSYLDSLLIWQRFAIYPGPYEEIFVEDFWQDYERKIPFRAKKEHSRFHLLCFKAHEAETLAKLFERVLLGQISAEICSVFIEKIKIEVQSNDPSMGGQRLLVEIWTNGKITPKMVLNQAQEALGLSLKPLFAPIENLKEKSIFWDLDEGEKPSMKGLLTFRDVVDVQLFQMAAIMQWDDREVQTRYKFFEKLLKEKEHIIKELPVSWTPFLRSINTFSYDRVEFYFEMLRGLDVVLAIIKRVS